jgi:signal transduction histidine kinase
MKSLMKILVRYVLTASGIALILAALNLAVLISWIGATGDISKYEYRISQVAAALTSYQGTFTMSDIGQKAMENRYQWAMLLNDQGKVIWSLNLPEGLPDQYSVRDVASFTHWYLNDYPVYVWQHPDGLLVLGEPRGSRWKTDLEMSTSALNTTLAWIPVVILLNIIAAVILAILLGLRLFRSLRILVNGIEDIGDGKPVDIPTGGLLGDLAGKLNRTSDLLRKQDIALAKRDDARATWIAGISHDIRTPLSMIMGYASQLEENPRLIEDDREQAGIIRRQGQKINALVNDLNLTSRLEYAMQPLQLANIFPAKLLRNIVAEFLNNNLDERFQVELDIKPEAQGLIISGDEKLLERVIANLINNSREHNPSGCSVHIQLCRKSDQCEILVDDDGIGFDQAAMDDLSNSSNPSLDKKQGLGLTIVRQIIQVHGGSVKIRNLQPAGCSVKISLPVVDPGD